MGRATSRAGSGPAAPTDGPRGSQSHPRAALAPPKSPLGVGQGCAPQSGPPGMGMEWGTTVPPTQGHPDRAEHPKLRSPSRSGLGGGPRHPGGSRPNALGRDAPVLPPSFPPSLPPFPAWPGHRALPLPLFLDQSPPSIKKRHGRERQEPGPGSLRRAQHRWGAAPTRPGVGADPRAELGWEWDWRPEWDQGWKWDGPSSSLSVTEQRPLDGPLQPWGHAVLRVELGTQAEMQDKALGQAWHPWVTPRRARADGCSWQRWGPRSHRTCGDTGDSRRSVGTRSFWRVGLDRLGDNPAGHGDTVPQPGKGLTQPSPPTV